MRWQSLISFLFVRALRVQLIADHICSLSKQGQAAVQVFMDTQPAMVLTTVIFPWKTHSVGLADSGSQGLFIASNMML